jgi:hypothetical protein
VDEESSASARTVNETLSVAYSQKATYMRYRSEHGTSQDYLTSRSLHFLVGPYDPCTVLTPVFPSNGFWTRENSTSFGQKLGLDEHYQPRKDSHFTIIASTSITQDHTGLSETILAFVYARLVVGQLTRKLASLPLIKVFCSRFWANCPIWLH